jgi:hypothetical protein
VPIARLENPCTWSPRFSPTLAQQKICVGGRFPRVHPFDVAALPDLGRGAKYGL